MSRPELMNETPTPSTNPDNNTPTAADRREALRKLGAMAALTPPAVMTLLLTPRNSAASLGPPIDP